LSEKQQRLVSYKSLLIVSFWLVIPILVMMMPAIPERNLQLFYFSLTFALALLFFFVENQFGSIRAQHEQ